MKWIAVVACLAVPHVASAQEPVAMVPEVVSFGTAAVNPVMAAVKALRSEHRVCHLGQLAIAEAIGQTATLTMKHFINSPRPCIGCDPDGMPSGHSMNSAIGSSWNWKYSFAFSLSTMELRRLAHKHTLPQVLAGAGIGWASELIGQNLLRCQAG